MNNEELVALAIAGIAVWMIVQSRKAVAQPAAPVANPAFAPSFTREILNSAMPGEPGYGWRYFTDGLAISPQNEYIKNGGVLWQP